VRYLPVLLPILVAGNVGAEEIKSAYTEFDAERDCLIVDHEEGEDWVHLVCSGYKGYPVFLYYSDVRESAFYGFPPQDGRPAWGSFTSINNAGQEIEWRMRSMTAARFPLPPSIAGSWRQTRRTRPKTRKCWWFTRWARSESGRAASSAMSSRPATGAPTKRRGR